MWRNIVDHLGKAVHLTDEDRRAANALACCPGAQYLQLQLSERSLRERLVVVPAALLHHGRKAPYAVDMLRLVLDRKTRPAFLDRESDSTTLQNVGTKLGFKVCEVLCAVVLFGLQHTRRSQHDGAVVT